MGSLEEPLSTLLDRTGASYAFLIGPSGMVEEAVGDVPAEEGVVSLNGETSQPGEDRRLELVPLLVPLGETSFLGLVSETDLELDPVREARDEIADHV